MISSSYEYRPVDPTRRYKGIAIVIVLHIGIIWLFASGLARKSLEIIKKPLEAAVIQEVIIPPPPPPPPKEIKPPEPQAPKVESPPPPFVPPPDVPVQSAGPAITAVAAPPPTPAVIAPPPPPPAPPAPVRNRSDISVACPTQVKPEMPRKALQEGISGTVRAEILISNGVVKDVQMTGPRIYYPSVRAAIMSYKCTSDGEVKAVQEFNFKLDE